MILTASGGLVYHTRAAFHRELWQPTRQRVSQLVLAWLSRTQSDRLVLVGPSSGYLLERDLFRNHELIVIEPDRLASLIFRHRFASSPIKWHFDRRVLPFTSSAPRAFADFLKLAKRSSPERRPNPKIAILFFGVLGQISLHQNEFTRPKNEARQILLDSLHEYEWASLHDLESTTLSGELHENPRLLLESNFENLNTQRERLEEVERRLKSTAARPGDWIDHETDWIGPVQATVPWLLTPKRLHLLGFTTSLQAGSRERNTGGSTGRSSLHEAKP